MAIRAVIDTSALVRPSVRKDLQKLAQAGLFEATWSPWIIAELNRVLTWRWITDLTRGDLSRANERRCSQAAQAMMEILLATFTLVNPESPYPPAWPDLTDAWDMPIWAAAKVEGAEYVISENTHDFPPRQADGRHVYEGIEYLTSAAFIALLTGDVR